MGRVRIELYKTKIRGKMVLNCKKTGDHLDTTPFTRKFLKNLTKMVEQGEGGAMPIKSLSTKKPWKKRDKRL